MKTQTDVQPAIDIESVILTVRGQKVLLDSDLALIYRVPTFRFNEAVKRNADRFPDDFRFQLTEKEWPAVQRLRSQNAILKTGRGWHRKFLPYAFTEPGAIMDVLQRLMRLLDSPPEPEPPRRQIGFHVRPGDETTSASKGSKKPDAHALRDHHRGRADAVIARS